MLWFFCWKESWLNGLIRRNKLTARWHALLILHVTIWLKIWNFLSKMWNFKQIGELAIANVARFASLNAVFLSWAKYTTIWLYVPLTGHIKIPHTLKKVKVWGANHTIWPRVFEFFVPKLLFRSWCYGLFLERRLVERVNWKEQINLVVTCTADCTCYHLNKNIKHTCPILSNLLYSYEWSGFVTWSVFQTQLPSSRCCRIYSGSNRMNGVGS